VGASGAVSAVTFFLSFSIHGKIIFLWDTACSGYCNGRLYLVYSHFMSKRDIDNINHDAPDRSLVRFSFSVTDRFQAYSLLHN
jgi:hypothetical protein